MTDTGHHPPHTPSVEALDSTLFDFSVSIQPARRAWNQAASAVLASSGLSMSVGVTVILAFRLGQDALQGTIAAEAGVNPAAMVRTLDQAEEAGLLRRHEAPGNRRGKVIQLLPKGKKIAQKMEVALAVLRRELLSDIPASDIEAATRVLRTLEARSLAHIQEERRR